MRHYNYKPSMPPAALVLTTLAAAVITMGSMVVLPAKLEFADGDQNKLAAARAMANTSLSGGNAQCASETEVEPSNRAFDRRAPATRAVPREQ
jgi:hypothetical protein